MPRAARRRAFPRRSRSRPSHRSRSIRIRAAVAAGVAPGVVLMDASYGSNSDLRNGISALALSYVAGIVPTIKVQAVIDGGKPNKRWGRAERQGAGARPAQARLAQGDMARRQQQAARLALCPRARAYLAHPARQGAGGGDAADRMAARRGGAHQILALDPAQGHLLPQARRHRQDALARRARLPGPQAGDRARALRGTRMDRLPSSRQHCASPPTASWSPKGDDSPLRTSSRRESRETCPTRRLPTPRRPRSGRNATSPTRSPPSIADWRWRSLERSRDAHAAHVALHELPAMPYDAVRLIDPTRRPWRRVPSPCSSCASSRARRGPVPAPCC